MFLPVTINIAVSTVIWCSMFLFPVILFFWFLNVTVAIKIWLPSTSLGNPLNLNKYPLDSCDRLILDKANGVNILVPVTSSINIQSIDFPRDGILTFPSKSEIVFGNSLNSCPPEKGQDVEFVGNLVKGWLDPTNWRDSASTYKWVPDRERIPCAGEPIFFPAQQSFNVLLPAVLLPISTINVQNQRMGADEWSTYLQSEEGYESFEGASDARATIWRSRVACSTEGMCQCAISPYTIRDWVIQDVSSTTYDESICFYAKPRCEPPLCHSPIQPDGHCCPVCGAIVNLHGEIPSKSLINSVVEAVLQRYVDLIFYAGLTSDGHLQIVILSSNGELSDALDVAQLLSTRFSAIVQGSHVSLTYSGSSNKFSKTPSAIGVIFGTLTSVIFMMASIYYVYVILPKQKWAKFTKKSPFAFARFRNTLPEAGSEETLVFGAEQQDPSPAVDSFLNPLFSVDNVDHDHDDESLRGNESAEPEAEESQTLVSLDDEADAEVANDEPGNVDENEDSPAADSDHEGSIVSFSQLRTHSISKSDDE